MKSSKVAVDGEELASDFLENEGWEIIGRNVTYKIGEIDIIAQKTIPRGLGRANMVAFVEVKTRTSERDPRSAERAITTKKRKKIILASRMFLSKNKISACIARFDVIAITLKRSEEPEIRHYPNAFDASGAIR